MKGYKSTSDIKQELIQSIAKEKSYLNVLDAVVHKKTIEECKANIKGLEEELRRLG